MKKLLIATAALAMVAGTVQAQSSVTIYGIIDMSYVSTNNDAATNASTAGDVVGSNLSSSRLGFKGTEDLGGGLKANFFLEAGLTADTGALGTTTTFSRGSWVGLQNSMGELRLGKVDISNMSNFATAVLSTAGNFHGTGISSFTADVNNGVVYVSPSMNGFSFQVGHAGANAVTTTTITEATTGGVDAVSAEYKNGGLTVAVGKAEQKADASTDNLEETIYGVKYNFKVAEVALIQNTRDKSAGGAELKGTVASIAAPVSALGKGVKVHAVWNKYVAEAASTDYTAYRLALTKAFSKRTTGYAAYTSTKVGDTTTTTPTSMIVGVSHSF